MIEILKTANDNKLIELGINEAQSGSWFNLIDPTYDEIQKVSLILNSYKDNIISNNIYGKNKSFLVIDILRIIETVEEKAKLIYQLIS